MMMANCFSWSLRSWILLLNFLFVTRAMSMHERDTRHTGSDEMEPHWCTFIDSRTACSDSEIAESCKNLCPGGMEPLWCSFISSHVACSDSMIAESCKTYCPEGVEPAWCALIDSNAGCSEAIIASSCKNLCKRDEDAGIAVSPTDVQMLQNVQLSRSKRQEFCDRWCKDNLGAFVCCKDLPRKCPIDSRPQGSCATMTVSAYLAPARCYEDSDCRQGLLCCYDACLGQTCKNPV